ncbi:two-component sensor histidine kinase [Mycobacterium sp. 1164966.3]|uniref:sensor histidine kinase n=1 Tax=Mycobacterium sp. 1164966.3 TaxID=1856861 RepID=UPI0007FB7DCF|nr:histidine kinase [Mycobacterium sp. 1164966.3]OBA82641.1 two-component sensor histidine kinase [Mycobacterium sp. 1164966.3]
MASTPLRPADPAASVPYWRVPKVLLHAAVRSSSLLGHDLVYRLKAERFQLFLGYGYLAMYFGTGVMLPLWEYQYVLRSPWFLAIAGISTAQSAVLVVGLRLARHRRYQQSITLVCIGNWIAVLLITFVAPVLLPVMVLAALIPVVFAEPYIRRQRGLAFTMITAGCVLALAAIARFQNVAVVHAPRWIETSFIVAAMPVNALLILVIVWNNANALRTSEKLLAERAAQLEASRGRLITAADEERRRLERDLHDGAQQHLAALAVLIQLARTAGPDRYQPLLTEASGLVETAIAEIRRLAHGIYPPLLVSGGLAAALPAVAAHAPIPVQLNLHGLGRYDASTEAALYFCCSEALQNATKHGGEGTTVTITADADDRTLTLTISDTGQGFDAATIGAGMTNMTDRLSAIGGDLTIDTAPGRGTRITAVIPTTLESGNAETADLALEKP